MKTIIRRKTLLVLAIASSLAACSNQAVNNDTVPTVITRQDTVLQEAEAGLPDLNSSVTRPANQSSNAATQEIMVTGSRISDRTVSYGNQNKVAATGSTIVRMPQPEYSQNSVNRENYADFDDSSVKSVLQNPVSTFSIDVDTGAYSNVRRFLMSGHLPPQDAVRTEELINYFSYDYPRPETATPFSFHTEVAASPWNQDRLLLHVGLMAADPLPMTEVAANLVFLIDVSGSMNSPDKLDLLKTSLRMLGNNLDAKDKVSIVVYAGASGTVLEPTAGNDSRAINNALNSLAAGGSTNGHAGIQLAYDLAEQAYIENGINRIILATDGDFNVGVTNFEDLKSLVSTKRQTGISLTTLGFGTGNFNDHLMEQLADAGNGNYAYIDNINEARKVLVDEMNSTLQTVASDVKLQIEFNPAVVAEYRLVGYENRTLAREDFNNDKVDAGEIGAGHTVTAIYELSLQGSHSQSLDPLRYNSANTETEVLSGNTSELAFLKLRYKTPGEQSSQLLEQVIAATDIQEDVQQSTANFRFSAAVAGFGQLLRGNNNLQNFDYAAVLNLAQGAKGDDEFGYRAEFMNLVRTAQTLSQN